MPEEFKDRRKGPVIYHLTSTLSAGAGSPRYEHYETDDAEEAVRLIDSEKCAHVPTIKLGIAVMERLGLTEAQIERRVHFALTGVLLPQPT